MKKIMLATDGSQPAKHAAEFLARLPHDKPFELSVVSILDVPGADRLHFLDDWIQASLDRERKQADEAFSEIEGMFSGANIELRQIVRKGHPSEQIVEIAREEKPELVVIGAIGHSSILRMLLGSTSDYVATHAPCSVLVVRPTGMLKGEHPLRVAIGYEESTPAEAAVEEFAEFNWGSETETHVVSVTYIPGFYEGPDQLKCRDFVDDAARKLHHAAPGAKGCLVEHDHIGEGLVNYTESHGIDLLVVGETPRSRFGRVLMGSMTRFVLRHAVQRLDYTQSNASSVK